MVFSRNSVCKMMISQNRQILHIKTNKQTAKQINKTTSIAIPCVRAFLFGILLLFECGIILLNSTWMMIWPKSKICNGINRQIKWVCACNAVSVLYVLCVLFIGSNQYPGAWHAPLQNYAPSSSSSSLHWHYQFKSHRWTNCITHISIVKICSHTHTHTHNFKSES